MTDTSPPNRDPGAQHSLRPGWRHREHGVRRPADGKSSSIHKHRNWLDRLLAARGITGHRRKRLMRRFYVGCLLLGVMVISILLMSLLSREVFEAVPLPE